MGSDGEMAADVLIEDDDNYYYVDENSAMVRNQWVAVENEDAGQEDEPDHYWYYFQSNGKAYKRSNDSNSLSPKTINGKKYAFDTDGKMLYGLSLIHIWRISYIKYPKQGKYKELAKTIVFAMPIINRKRNYNAIFYF